MLLVVFILVVLATSFFCSLSEASLLTVSRARIEALTSKSRAARLVSHMKAHLDRPIAAILIMNTVANTGGAALAGREYQRMFGGENMVVFSVFLTLAVLIFGELLPKTLGVRHGFRASLMVAAPLLVMIRLMRPFTWCVEQMSRLLGRRDSSSSYTLEDLRAAARLAASSKSLGREEMMIIDAASRLPKLPVSQIMIHARDVVYLSLADDDEVLLLKARRSMHSRLLLCRNDLNDVLGVVNVKEVLWRLVLEGSDEPGEPLKRMLGEAVRPPLFVRPKFDVSHLLREFSQQHGHLAVVRGEDHRVVGIVTLEDVIEEIIGEVDDEYDSAPQHNEKIGVGLYRFGGGTSWAEAAEVLNVSAEEFIPEERKLDGRFDVHDLAQSLLRGKLRTGGLFFVGKWRFKVTRMRRGKVFFVEVLLPGSNSSPRGKSVSSEAPARLGDLSPAEPS
jgi:CBS domain containing-hemolysin-like protein